MKKLILLAVITVLSFPLFSQIKDTIEVDKQFHFCLIIPERDSGFVILQCADGKGTTIYMKVREDMFVGKLNIIITPDENLGPITKEKTINWFMLPEEE